MPNSSTEKAASGFSFGFNDGTLALMGTAVLLFASVTWTSHSANVDKTDFSLTYVGATIVHNGAGRELYDLALQRRLRESLFQHPVPLFFEHPPFEAVLLSPLASLPFQSAYLIWGYINAAIWLTVMYLSRTYLPWPRDAVAYFFLWVIFAPLWVALYQGQSSFFVLASYTIAFALLKRDEDYSAGVALGLGLVKFQFALPFALIFLLRRRRRFLAGFSTAALVLAVLSIVAVGWKGLASYTRFLITIGNNPQNISYGSGVDMPTIHGFVYAILGKHFSARQLNILVALLSLSLLGWLAMRWRGLEDRSFNLMFAAAIGASLLCGSHMFTHDFSPLILAMLLVAGQDCVFPSAGWGSAFAGTSTRSALAVFWTFPIYFLFVKWHCLFLLGPALFLFVWGAVRVSSVQKTHSVTVG
jgi:hypothetical protein